MTGRALLASAKRIIVKTGSALIADEAGQPRTPWLECLAADIAQWRADGRDIVLVTSGAIALGKAALGRDKLKRLEDKQAAAALGQPRLMSALNQAFSSHGICLLYTSPSPRD